jgi:hypothetical protein
MQGAAADGDGSLSFLSIDLPFDAGGWSSDLHVPDPCVLAGHREHSEIPGSSLRHHFGPCEKLPTYLQKYCPPNHWDKKNVQIDSFSILDGGCMIKSGVVIENSALGEDCRIEEGVLIKDSVI